jgi:hypothetical protein
MRAGTSRSQETRPRPSHGRSQTQARGAVQLTVVHDGLLPGSATLEQALSGMPFILSGLKTLLETGEQLVAA